MTGFALYRLPYAAECTLISGEVYTLQSLSDLGLRTGFVLAPFAPSHDHPVLLIRPDTVEQWSGRSVPCRLSPLSGSSEWSDHSRSTYHSVFTDYHTRLVSGDFRKLVLARSIDVRNVGHASPFDMFQRACECYPRMFVSLAYTEDSGLWLTATPEILLSGDGHRWQTIALAGTMAYADQVSWSDKNIQEQRFVATYISSILQRYANDVSEEGPRTVRAGHLAHLRSDFRFTLADRQPVGLLLHDLHPTPAVCGLPKREAFRFIMQHEPHDRSYYSGFMGPLFVDGLTNLFVTLRCMRIFQDGYRLYAGGGLLTDSVEEEEWLETEAKLDTMRRIIYNNV